MVVKEQFWKDKKVLVTGHTGFKGSWLSLWLSYLGAKVYGFALSPSSERNIFVVANVSDVLEKNIINDVRDAAAVEKNIESIEPEIVIHLAAQALVRESYYSPVETYSANIMGTVNILEACRNSRSVKTILNITSDKCYKNNEWLWGYRENEPLGGDDPYSSSKACAELVSNAYRISFLEQQNIALATARAGNVIGGGDWAKDRLIPDIINSFINQNELQIRNPNSVRPWQHVLEPLSGYLTLCQKLHEQPDDFSQAWNFGPYHNDAIAVADVVNKMIKTWDQDITWKYTKADKTHEANLLNLDCSKSNKLLNWLPQWRIDRSIEETVNWYRAWKENADMQDFSIHQIKRYQYELENNDSD